MSSVAVGSTNAETTGAAVEEQVSCTQIYTAAAIARQETGEACENVNMIKNDSSDDETSDEQDDDSEDDEDDE